MAYTSRLPRESVYPAPHPSSFDFLAHLDECVTTTEACCSTLSAGLGRLHPGVADLPRLTKVLQNKHHYLLLPQPVIAAHKSSLSTSLAPQIETLMSRAENLISTHSGRIARLEERLSILQSARLPAPESESERHPSTFSDAEEGGESWLEQEEGGRILLEGLEMKDLNPAQRRRLVICKGKRERLEKEKARLAAQEGKRGGVWQ